MEQVAQISDAQGQTTWRTNRYTVLANGMHFRGADGRWVECQPVVVDLPGGIICTGVSYRVILSHNLNAVGAVDLDTSDHQRTVSQPLGIGFYDPESGRSVLLATINDCHAELVATNRVLYADAFEGGGIEADVTYTYGIGHLHQDVTFKKRPAFAPSDFGMGRQTRLEVYTEFTQGISSSGRTRILRRETDAVKRASMVEPDLVDEALKFSEEMILKPGKAFYGAQGEIGLRGVPVAKQLQRTEDGRILLVEAVEWEDVKSELEKLPVRIASLSPPAGRGPLARQFPERRRSEEPFLAFETRLARVAAVTTSGLVALSAAPSQARRGAEGSALLAGPAGFVIDYEAVECLNDLRIRGGTYLIESRLDVFGHADCLSGVIKFSAGEAAGLALYDNLDRFDSMVLTARDDNSAGEIIQGATGNPWATVASGRRYGFLELSLEAGAAVGGLDLRFMDVAMRISCNKALNVVSSYLRNCGTGFELGSGNAVSLAACDLHVCRVGQLVDSNSCDQANSSISLGEIQSAECDDLSGSGTSGPLPGSGRSFNVQAASASQHAPVQFTPNTLTGTWYVNSGFGDDSYDGQSADYSGSSGPFLRINRALSVAVDGHTVVIAAGTYHENVDLRGTNRLIQISGKVTLH